MVPASASSPLPTDPRGALGPSLFISILHHLPFPSLLAAELVSRAWRATLRDHENGLWRATCRRSGLEPEHMAKMEQLEKAMSSTSWAGDPEEPEPIDPEEPGGSVDWRGVCKGFVEHDRNWRFGRARERWITPEGCSTWRIKVDPEQGTLISTSRSDGGLLVSDLDTSQTLFKLERVHDYAHLEFAKGFIVFDGGRDDGGGLYVYRTQQAVIRSSQPTPPAARRPRGAEWGISSQGLDMSKHIGPLPRGHLTYYRHIIPPTLCRAFRARVDHEGGPEERAILGTAGTEAVYLWDLDDPTRMETIPIDIRDQSRIQYIEFDDNFVFVCTKKALLVYSRATRARMHLLNASVYAEAGLKYEVKVTLDDKPVIRPSARDGFAPTPTSRLTAERILSSGDLTTTSVGQYISPRGGPDYIACHYTTNDLICLSRHGGCLIIRNYKQVLRESGSIWHHSIWLGIVGQEMSMLSTHADRVGIVTDRKIFFFDTSALSRLDSFQSPAIPEIHIIRSTLRASVAISGCLQMDRSNIYLSYMATDHVLPLPVDEPDLLGEAEALGPRLGGLGCCVKVWNFTP